MRQIQAESFILILVVYGSLMNTMMRLTTRKTMSHTNGFIVTQVSFYSFSLAQRLHL